MPGHLNSTIRQRLEQAGKWRQFRQLRDSLKREGFPAEQANARALRKYLPREGPKLPPLPAELASRRGCETDSIRWVARNLDNPAPDPKACPDATAWLLLRQCRENPAFRMDFIEKIWAKLIPADGGQREEGPGEAIDTTPSPELLERIRELSR